MGFKQAYNDVMREYGRDIDRAKRTIAERKEEMYSKIPKLSDIDTALRLNGINISRAVLSGGGDLTRLREENAALSDEKRQLIAAGGYPEDYLEEVFKCKMCRDTGHVGNERCACLKQRLIEKYYDLSNLKSILAVENFDTFDIRLYSDEVDPSAGLSPKANMKNIYQVCIGFTDGFGREFNNLLFYGNTGLGKTFLCNAIAKDVLDMGKTVLYVTAPKLCKIIEANRFNRDETEEPDDYITDSTEVDLLIIDDLGTEFPTVVTSSELFNILNTRLLEKRPTVISTNLSPADFEHQYSERIISRFFGYYQMLKFIGDDIRVKMKYRKKYN